MHGVKLLAARSRRHRMPLLLASLALTLSGAALLAPEPVPADAVNDCASTLTEAAHNSETPTLDFPPLRVVSWNLLKLSRDGSAELLRNLADHSDLLLLQESLEDAPATVQDWRLFAAGFRREGLHSGVEIRAPAPAELSCRLTFIEPWLRTPKGVAVARFRLADGERLLVVNLHAINFTLGSDDYREQFQAIGDLLSRHRGPAIVGGDLNNWNAWRDRVLDDFITEEGLARVEISPDWRSRHLGRPVDALLVRGLRVVAAAALPTDRSDHNPVAAILDWPQPAAPVAAAGSSPTTAR